MARVAMWWWLSIHAENKRNVLHWTKWKDQKRSILFFCKSFSDLTMITTWYLPMQIWSFSVWRSVRTSVDFRQIFGSWKDCLRWQAQGHPSPLCLGHFPKLHFKNKTLAGLVKLKWDLKVAHTHVNRASLCLNWFFFFWISNLNDIFMIMLFGGLTDLAT